MRKVTSVFYLSVFFLALVSFWQIPALAAEDSADTKKVLKLEKKARKIHRTILTVDTHLDTPWVMDFYSSVFGKEFDLGSRDHNPDFPSQVDFPRMQDGGLDAGFFVAFIPQGNRDDVGNQAAIKKVLGLIDLIYEKVGAYPDTAEVVSGRKDAQRLKKNGKKAIYIGIENGYAIGKNLAMVETYYDRGVRYMGLAHTLNNDICDSSTDPDGAEHDGLSSFGEEVVSEMNRLGMIVDVSHISDNAAWDILAVTIAPIIASHSNARSVFDHPRNLNDDLLRAIAENGGVVQTNLFYVSPEDRIPAVSDFVDHIDHIVGVAGINHVGIGTDFDGGGKVEGCEDVSKIEAITLELVKRGYNKRKIRKIWGENFMRVFRAVEKTAGT